MKRFSLFAGVLLGVAGILMPGSASAQTKIQDDSVTIQVDSPVYHGQTVRLQSGAMLETTTTDRGAKTTTYSAPTNGVAEFYVNGRGNPNNVATVNADPNTGIATFDYLVTEEIGSTITFEAKYGASGAGQAVWSPKVTTTVLELPSDECEEFGIASTLVSGNGGPAPGTTHTWTYDIVVRAPTCSDVVNVTAQGGINSWTTVNSITADKGTPGLRKATGNGKNQSLLWNIGDMAAGEVATLTITVSGKASSVVGTEMFLSGAWSALHSVVDEDGFVVPQPKSAYTDRVSVTVTSNLP